MSNKESLFEPIDPTRVSDKAVQQILGLIETGRLQSGDQLPGERELTRQLAISRTAVREAIRLLEAQGILEVRPGLGTFVADRALLRGLPNRWRAWLAEHRGSVLDLLDVRSVLEPLAASLAAQRATAADISAIRFTVARMTNAVSEGNMKEAVEEDIHFHRLISECGNNPFLIELNKSINSSLLENRYAYYSFPERAKASCEQHKQVLDAIEAHKPDLAAEAMRRHLLSSREFLAELNLTEDS